MCLRVAVDERARLKGAVEELAKHAPGDDAGTKLRHALLALQGAETAWLYAEVAGHGRAIGSAAQASFEGLVAGTRAASFVPEPRTPDGEARVVVMTLIVASKQPLPEVSDGTLVGRVKALLEGMRSTADPLAVEVVWSPRFKQDHFSSTELRWLFPAIERLDERTVAPRRFCHQCAWPYPPDLAQRPSCGAPST